MKISIVNFTSDLLRPYLCWILFYFIYSVLLLLPHKRRKYSTQTEMKADMQDDGDDR